MKTLFPFIIFGVILGFSYGHGAVATSSIHIRSYPKKYDSILHRHLNILNRRYLKPTQTELTKRPNTDKTYTAFPPIPENRKQLNFPESPYFSLGTDLNENKVRIKKVLPQFPFKIRRKRDATTKANTEDKKPAATTVQAKTENSKITTAIAKTEKNKKATTAKAKVKAEKPKTLKNADKGKAEPKKKSKKSKNKVTKKPKRGGGKEAAKAVTSKGKKSKGKARRSGNHHPELVNGTRRLIAALDTPIEDYPYTVSIQKEGEHWCAGALINQKLVVTTANCVWKSTYYSRMTVRACSRFADRGGQKANIQEVMKHPKWSARKNPDCDIALVLLDRFIKFSHGCHAVDLPNKMMLPIFDDAWVTSWGAERRDGIYEKREMTLQVYHNRFINREKCNNITQRFGVTVSPNFLCMVQSGKRAPCTRDTGAPAVSDGIVWGLASWGLRKLCGTERFPAMFSFTASHNNMDFLSAATTNLMSEHREDPFPPRFEAQG